MGLMYFGEKAQFNYSGYNVQVGRLMTINGSDVSFYFRITYTYIEGFIGV